MKKLYAVITTAFFLSQQIFAQLTFSGKTDFITGDLPSYISTGDLNGDGRPDLVVANCSGSNSISVFFNTTLPGAVTPAFSTKTDFTTVGYPSAASIGDLNGDGKPDVAVSNANSSLLSVFLNTTVAGNAAPTFAGRRDFTAGSAPYGVCMIDINGDGKLDLVTTNTGSNTSSVLINTTTPGAAVPTFSAKADFTTGSSPYYGSCGDINGDGRSDLLIPNYDANTISVLLNTTTPGSITPTFSSKTDFLTVTNPRSVSIGDINGDGKPDIAVGHAGVDSISIFLNTTTPGAATPAFSAAINVRVQFVPLNVCLKDMNGDGKADLITCSNYYNNASVLINTTDPGAATPRFSARLDFAVGNYPYFVSADDFNGDEKPDLVTANYSANTVSVLLNTTVMASPALAFSIKTDFFTGTSPYFVLSGNVNGDGKPDLAVLNYDDDSVSVLLNATDPGASIPELTGKKNLSTAANPRSAAFGDLNGDGKEDLAVIGGASTLSVFLNNTPTGTSKPSYSARTDLTTGSNPGSVSIGDFNGDGMPDLVTSNGASTVSIFLNTTSPGAATPTFSLKKDFATGSGPRCMAIGDFNGDGKPDIATSNLSARSVSVLMDTTEPGDTKAAFTAKTDFVTGTQPYAIYACDLNGDGKPDLVTANYGTDSVSVFLNTTNPGSLVPSFTLRTDFPTNGNPTSVFVKDINGDFKPDIVCTGLYSSAVSILVNTTTPGAVVPSFTARTDFTVGSGPYSVSIQDLNDDGKQDLAVANYIDATISILLNTTDFTVGVESEPGLSPVIFGLAQNYPNPFNPNTKISFKLANREYAKLVVYNLLGQQVGILFDGIAEKEREYNLDFEASHLAGGVYFYKMQTPTRTEVRKMLLMK